MANVLITVLLFLFVGWLGVRLGEGFAKGFIERINQVDIEQFLVDKEED